MVSGAFSWDSAKTRERQSTSIGKNPWLNPWFKLTPDTWTVKATAQTGEGRPGNRFGERTHCKNGHEFTEENTYVRAGGQGRGCRECKRTRNRAFRSVARNKIDERARDSVRKRAKRNKVTVGDEIKKHPLDSLKLNANQTRAEIDLSLEVDRGSRPKCIDNPDAYSFELEETVTDEYAKLACDGCPLMGTGKCLADVKATSSKWLQTIGEGRIIIDGTARKRGK